MKTPAKTFIVRYFKTLATFFNDVHTERETRGYAWKTITCLQIDKTTFSASILSQNDIFYKYFQDAVKEWYLVIQQECKPNYTKSPIQS